MRARLPMGLRRSRSDRLRTGHYRGIPHLGEEVVSACWDRRAVRPAPHHLPAGALLASPQVVVLLVSSDSFVRRRGLCFSASLIMSSVCSSPRGARVYSDGPHVAPHELPPVFRLRSLCTENPKGG